MNGLIELLSMAWRPVVRQTRIFRLRMKIRMAEEQLQYIIDERTAGFRAERYLITERMRLKLELGDIISWLIKNS